VDAVTLLALVIWVAVLTRAAWLLAHPHRRTAGATAR
jgi:hypothetical protein